MACISPADFTPSYQEPIDHASNSASAARENQDRFQLLSPACLSRSEKSSVVKLALAMLSSRYRPGHTFTSRSYIEGFLRLKLSGRRNEVFGGRGRRFKSSHPDQ